MNDTMHQKYHWLPDVEGELKFALMLVCNSRKTIKVGDKHEIREALVRAIKTLEQVREAAKDGAQ